MGRGIRAQDPSPLCRALPSRAIERQSSTGSFLEDAKTASPGLQKVHAQKAKDASFEHDRVKKGKGKGKKEPEGQFTETILLKDSEVLLEKRIVHCVTVTKKEIEIEIESVILGISRTAEISRNVNVIRERIVHLFTDKNKIDPAIL